MTGTRLALVALIAAAALAAAHPAHAHTTVEVGPYEVEVGWGTEPPIEGLRNTVVYSITEAGAAEGVRSGVVGALSGAEVTLKFGGIEQRAEILNDPRAGEYYTKIIPSRAGSYSVAISGQIGDTPIDEVIPVEDVLGTAALDFPPRAGGGGEDVAALRNAIASMQRELDSAGPEAPAAGPAYGPAYDIALFGAAFGAAGTVLAIIAMVKRK